MTIPISILIRTFNSGATLAKVLESLDLLDCDECIVVDSGSSDDTLNIAERFGANIVRVTGDFHYSKSLNVGFEQARHAWVLVLSSHCIPLQKNLLHQFRILVAELPDRLAVIYGVSKLYDDGENEGCPSFGNMQSWRAGHFKPGGNTIAMYAKELWKEKPFSCSIPTAEDHDWFVWAMEKGFRACRLPTASVLYRNRASLLHMFRKGKNENVFVLRLHGKPPSSQRFLSYTTQLVKSVLHLIKLLVERRIDVGTFVRGCFFRAGAWVSYFSIRFSEEADSRQ